MLGKGGIAVDPEELGAAHVVHGPVGSDEQRLTQFADFQAVQHEVRALEAAPAEEVAAEAAAPAVGPEELLQPRSEAALAERPTDARNEVIEAVGRNHIMSAIDHQIMDVCERLKSQESMRQVLISSKEFQVNGDREAGWTKKVDVVLGRARPRNPYQKRQNRLAQRRQAELTRSFPRGGRNLNWQSKAKNHVQA